jgi:hypothetical protein
LWIGDSLMLHGLLWLPLLVFFFGLAWLGWKEYQKVEAYQTWAKQFDHAKYDIYAVLGQKGTELTWGLPTSKGMVDLQTFSLHQVRSLRLLVNGQLITAEPPSNGKAILEFDLQDQSGSLISIAFTEPAIAAGWQQHLQTAIAQLKPESNEPRIE